MIIVAMYPAIRDRFAVVIRDTDEWVTAIIDSPTDESWERTGRRWRSFGRAMVDFRSRAHLIEDVIL